MTLRVHCSYLISEVNTWWWINWKFNTLFFIRTDVCLPFPQTDNARNFCQNVKGNASTSPTVQPPTGIIKVVLWRKLHLSYLSHFETSTRRLHEKKNAVYCFQISLRSRDIQVFKICKLAKWWRHTLNQILFKYDEKRYLSQFVSEMFDSLQ